MTPPASRPLPEAGGSREAYVVATPGDRIKVLQSDEWFRGLPQALQRALVDACETRRYPAGGLVYSAGDPPTGMFAVLSGEVRLVHHARSGKYAFYASVPPGGWFGGLSELDHGPRFSDAVAASATTVLQLSHAAFQRLYANDRQARDAFIAFICQNLRTTLSMLVETHAASPRQLVAQLLVSRAVRLQDADGGTPPRLTQEVLAAMAGISRQTVSKVLRQLGEEGVVAVRYGSIDVLDVAALNRYAAGGA